MNDQPTFKFTFKPQGEVLEAFSASKGQRDIIIGPIGSGKTFQTMQRLLKHMCEQEPNEQGIRPSRWLAIRNTYPDLMSTTVKDWLEFTGSTEEDASVNLGKFKQGGLEPPTHKLDFYLPDGTRVQSEVIFLALDREDASRKLRGHQVTGVWLNEAKELEWENVTMAFGRTGRYPNTANGGVKCTWQGIIGDTNAPDGDESEWVYRLAEIEKPEGWQFFKQPGGVYRAGTKDDGKPLWKVNRDAENAVNLPPGYYENQISGNKDDWIAVNLGNEYGFVSSGKPIFPEYRDNLMCKDFELLEDRPLYIGVDFGLTPAAIFGQETVTGQVRWLDEVIANDMGATRFGEALAEHILRHYPRIKLGDVIGDPSGDNRDQGAENRALQLLKDVLREKLGVEISVLPAHTNDWTPRREAVAVPMTRLIDGQPGFLIHPRCVITRKALGGGYCFKRVQKSGSEKFMEKPDKNKYSHPAEAGQYLNLGMGQGMAKVSVAQKYHGTGEVALAASEYDVFRH